MMRVIFKMWLVAALFAGCAVAQDASSHKKIETVSSLQPTFSWSSPSVTNITFDFIVCAGVDQGKNVWVPGKTVYYRQGLTTNSHKVEQKLAPDTVYVWSVRTRQGTKTSIWAPEAGEKPGKKERINVISRFRTPSN